MSLYTHGPASVRHRRRPSLTISNIFFSKTAGPIKAKIYLEPHLVRGTKDDDPGVTLTYFTAMSNLVTLAFLWEKVKTVNFSETIAANDQKVSRSIHLIEYMKVFEY